jgi:hypothetical protein
MRIKITELMFVPNFSKEYLNIIKRLIFAKKFESMDTFLMIFQIGTILYILVVTFFLIRAMNQYLTILSERNKLTLGESNLKIEGKKIELLLPLRMQAYERLILFLERIKPMALIARHLDPFTSRQQFQMSMLQNIRDEFEHNLSQQLFVSDTVWQTSKAAREEIAQQINLQSAILTDESTSADLAGLLVQIDTKLIDQAIKMIKEEMKAMA